MLCSTEMPSIMEPANSPNHTPCRPFSPKPTVSISGHISQHIKSPCDPRHRHHCGDALCSSTPYPYLSYAAPPTVPPRKQSTLVKLPYKPSRPPSLPSNRTIPIATPLPLSPNSASAHSSRTSPLVGFSLGHRCIGFSARPPAGCSPRICAGYAV
jgi:hypothetical protein